jgi:ABC-type Fe3+/spermidine/putrescine transport system ATPase subunit
MVRLNHLSKTFPGGTQAVKDLSVSVPEGEVFTMLGPSGCGKTTTLRMVAGLESPDTGSIYFRDDAIVDMDRGVWVPPDKRNVGMVFQSYAIWPHMTVEENVNYPLRLRGISKAECKDRVGSILEMVGLGGLEKRQAPLLSGGQQQRVALARALVYEPSVLLLDEPFSNLDTKLREQMRMEVKILQNRLKITVVFVTHDQVEALSLSDRIMVMNEGEPQQVGGPKDLYEDPANPFVRDFLGKTVLLHGKVQSLNQEGQVAVAVDGAPNCTLFGRTYSTADFNPGDGAYMAMRPEDVEVLPATDSVTPDGCIGGEVEAALFVGERIEYRIKVNDQTSILVYGERHQSIGGGQSVYLKFLPASMSAWKA